MRTVRSARGALLVVAALALATAGIALNERPAEPLRSPSLSSLAPSPGDTVTAISVADASPASVLAGHAPVGPRLGPLWALPGLAAALAAICLLRRLRVSPAPLARRVLLRDTVSGRAPPVAALA